MAVTRTKVVQTVPPNRSNSTIPSCVPVAQTRMSVKTSVISTLLGFMTKKRRIIHDFKNCEISTYSVADICVVQTIATNVKRLQQLVLCFTFCRYTFVFGFSEGYRQLMKLKFADLINMFI